MPTMFMGVKDLGYGSARQRTQRSVELERSDPRIDIRFLQHGMSPDGVIVLGLVVPAFAALAPYMNLRSPDRKRSDEAKER